MDKQIWKVSFKTQTYVRGRFETREWTEYWKSHVMPSKSACQGNFDYFMPVPGLVKVDDFRAESCNSDAKIALDI